MDWTDDPRWYPEGSIARDLLRLDRAIGMVIDAARRRRRYDLVAIGTYHRWRNRRAIRRALARNPSVTAFDLGPAFLRTQVDETLSTYPEGDV